MTFDKTEASHAGTGFCYRLLAPKADGMRHDGASVALAVRLYERPRGLYISDDELFFAAARALATQVTAAVATAAYDRGLATKPRPADLAAAAADAMYTPRYA